MSDYLKELFIDQVKDLGKGGCDCDDIGGGTAGGGGDFNLLCEFEVGTTVPKSGKVDLSSYDCKEFILIGDVPPTTDLNLTHIIDIGIMGKGLQINTKSNRQFTHAYIVKAGDKYAGFSGATSGWSVYQAYTIGATPRGTGTADNFLNISYTPSTESEFKSTYKLYGR